MTLIGKAQPNFTAEIFYVDSQGGGFAWQCTADGELILEGGSMGTQQEAISKFESGFSDRYPNAGDWSWETVQDPFESCSAKGEKVRVEIPEWSLIDRTIKSCLEFVYWKDSANINNVEGAFKFEVCYRTLLRAFASKHNLTPQRWNDGSTTWLWNPVALPCVSCGCEKPLVTNNDPGSNKPLQVECECGVAGPLAADYDGAIAGWNKIMQSSRAE